MGSGVQVIIIIIIIISLKITSRTLFKVKIQNKIRCAIFQKKFRRVLSYCSKGGAGYDLGVFVRGGALTSYRLSLSLRSRQCHRLTE